MRRGNSKWSVEDSSLSPFSVWNNRAGYDNETIGLFTKQNLNEHNFWQKTRQLTENLSRWINATTGKYF